jgi:hypothetical protein
MSAFANARLRRCGYVVTERPKQAGYLSPTPAAVPGAMHQHVGLCLRLSRH